jgi:beta-lactamase regulating signal transducer with metallopeptidase domain
MNTFDLSTVYMAILSSNILLVIIAVILRNEKIMINAGYKLISIFLILTLVRFVLPFEIPFATTFPLPTGISNIIIELFETRFTVLGLNINIFRILCLIWLIGVLARTYRFIKIDRMFRRFIFTFGRKVNKDPRYSAIINSLSTGETKHIPYQIYEVPNLPTPCLYGFATPYILIPANLDYTDKELTYVIRHEMMHYKHHDLWIKFGVQLISILYWWNPSGNMLLSNMDMALDMRIDDTLTEMNDVETSEYINSLYMTAEYQNSILNHKFGNVIAFSANDKTVSERRFLMLLNKNNEKKYWINFVLVTVVFAIYLLSYLVTFEGYTHDPDIKLDYVSATTQNSYLIDNGDGTYDVYFQSIKIECVNSLDNYSDDIPIYTMEEFENVQNNNPK